MKLTRLNTLLAVGFALLSNGCASLHPPADDRAAWLGQQEEATKEAEKQAAAWKVVYELWSFLGSWLNYR